MLRLAATRRLFPFAPMLSRYHQFPSIHHWIRRNLCIILLLFPTFYLSLNHTCNNISLSMPRCKAWERTGQAKIALKCPDEETMDRLRKNQRPFVGQWSKPLCNCKILLISLPV